MAGAFVANRGSGNVDGTFSLTWSFTTSGAVASGNKIIVSIANESNQIDSLSGGSLTWHKDGEIRASGVGTKMWISQWSADAPSGLSSGTTITVVDHSTGDGDLLQAPLVGHRSIWPFDWRTGINQGSYRRSDNQRSLWLARPRTQPWSVTSLLPRIAFPANAVSTDWTADTGYTKDVTLTGSSRGLWTEWNVVSSGGAVTSHATTSLTPNQWAMITAFYPATASSTPVNVTDSGSGSDASTEHAVYSRTDSASGADASTVIIRKSGTDSGSGSDASTEHAIYGRTENSTGSDSSSLSKTIPGTDNGTGTDASVLLATYSGGDSGAGSDASTKVQIVAVTDSGTGSDLPASLSPTPRAQTQAPAPRSARYTLSSVAAIQG